MDEQATHNTAVNKVAVFGGGGVVPVGHGDSVGGLVDHICDAAAYLIKEHLNVFHEKILLYVMVDLLWRRR